MIEMMVALLLFALLSTAVIMTITRANRITHEDAARVAATNLAVRELEITRDAFDDVGRGPDSISNGDNLNPLPGGSVGQPLVVDGTRFTVSRDKFEGQLGNNDAASACDQTGAAWDYFRVVVTVSWKARGDTQNVRMSTTMTPQKGTFSATKGAVGLKVFDSLGRPVAGVPTSAVTGSGAVAGSGTTGSDGCVLISDLDPGSYTIKLNRAGYVWSRNPELGNLTAAVVAGQLWRGSVEYDKAAKVDATFITRTGWSLPPTSGAAASTGINKIPITVANSAITPTGSRAITGTGATRSMTDLFPFHSGYELWAGNCADSDPGDFRDPPVVTDPGGSATAQVPLAPVTVTAPSGTITATHAADTSCSSGMTVTLGTPSGGSLKTSLPYGKWTLSRSGSGTTRVVTLTPPDPALPLPTPPTVAL